MRPAGGTDGTEASGDNASGNKAGHDGVSRPEASRAEAGRAEAGRAESGRPTAGSGTAGRAEAGSAGPDGTVATFRAAVAEVEAGLGRMRGQRPELTFEQEPAPRKLAPYAASVAVTVHDSDGDVGWGRFVLLYDPAGQRGWGGPFRIIGHIRVDLEPEIAADPLVGEVGWSWLTEALDARAVGYQQASGTVTRVVTEGFGAKRDEPVMTEFELRASWSPACERLDVGQAAAGQPRPAQAVGGPRRDARPGGGPSASSQPGSGPSGSGPSGSGPSGSGPSGSGPSGSGPSGSAELGSGRTAGLGLDGHVAAWCDALCAAAGLPPVAPGVRALRQPRGRRSR